MSVMGFQKKEVWMGMGGWGELYPVLFWIFGIFLNIAKPLSYADTIVYANLFPLVAAR